MTVSKFLLLVAVILFVLGALCASAVISGINPLSFGLWGLAFFAAAGLV